MKDDDGRRSQSPATRRNGTLQSCEPCRRSKQRCGHERPICRRCAMKKISDKCFYHPAPMTRRRLSEAAKSAVAPASSNGSRPLELTRQPISSSSSPGALGQGRIFVSLEPPSAPPGFLGSTSFSAVLAEHRNEIPFETEETTDSYPVLSVEPDRVQSGADVLLFLWNLHNRRHLIERYYPRACNAVVPKTVTDAILGSINEIFSDFNSNDIMPQLQNLATQIFQNSSQPLITHQTTTVQEYCSSFTGSNTRWEAIGNLFCLYGLQLVVTPENDPVFLEGSDQTWPKNRLLDQVIMASTICINFCDQTSSANELLAFLQYNDVMLLTQHYGDSSYKAWRRLGDLVATIYTAGLHLDTDSSDEYPFFRLQWRRGCFISAFYMDKMMASFVGRPPLMNYRYCNLEPPLDVSDDVLIEGGAALDKAISELDSNGWNTLGEAYRMTASRLRYQLAISREQTLDIALGTNKPSNLVRKSNEIQEQVRAVWEAAPDHIRYDRRELDSLTDGWLTIVYLYLNYLHTCFLLQRTLIKHTGAEEDALCDISRRILGIVNQICSQRNPLVDLDRHFSWIALTYGLPSASVLLVELLHQSQQPSSRAVLLPRAELIRNLSVFVSLLSWVARPGHGNYSTCKEAEKKLSRILDQLLDPQPVQADMVHDATSGLSSFLDWSNYNTWDFNSEYFPVADAFVQ